MIYGERRRRQKRAQIQSLKPCFGGLARSLGGNLHQGREGGGGGGGIVSASRSARPLFVPPSSSVPPTHSLAEYSGLAS